MIELKEAMHYVTDKIDVSSLKIKEYISTDNMVPNRGGIIDCESLPKANRVTRYEPGDILISNIRPYFKKIWFADRISGCSNDVIVFRTNNDNWNKKFLYYALSQDKFFDFMMASANGTKMPRGNKEIIPDFLIADYDIKRQTRIADILSAYDDLIKNNQQQIKLLEEATQRLYKEWFVDLHFPGYEDAEIVDGVPKGWKKNSMNEIAEYLNGYAFKPSDWGTEGLPIIKIKEMNDGITENTPRNSGEYIPGKYLIKAGDILFSWSATLTAMIWDSEDGLLNQHLFKVVPKAGITREFMFQSILKTLEEFKNLTTGSTMKHIQRGKLEQVYINVPTKDLMNEYSKQGETIRQEILILKKKISLLEEARDRLLPKLMSGEIEV